MAKQMLAFGAGSSSQQFWIGVPKPNSEAATQLAAVTNPSQPRAALGCLCKYRVGSQAAHSISHCPSSHWLRWLPSSSSSSPCPARLRHRLPAALPVPRALSGADLLGLALMVKHTKRQAVLGSSGFPFVHNRTCMTF